MVGLGSVLCYIIMIINYLIIEYFIDSLYELF